MSTIPFRLAPREASREELLRATVHPCSSTGFSPPAAFEPVGVILSKIRIGAYPDLQILCRAMAHPDERVPLTLVEWLGDGNARNLSPEVCDYIRIAALARGLADADREGITWGPLLDQLAASGHWPTQAAYDAFLKTARYYALPVRPPAYRPAEVQALPLVTWLASADEEALLHLLGARSPLIRRYAARYAGQPTMRFVEACLDTHPAFRGIAENPNLSGAQVCRVVDWILPRLKDGAPRLVIPAADMLIALERAGHRIPSDAIDSLALHCFSLPDSADEADRESRFLVLRTLLCLTRSIDQGLLERLAALAATDEECGILIVRHPKAGTAVWRTVAKRTPHVAVQSQLMATPAVTDDMILTCLARSTDTEILMPLLRHLGPREAQEIFTRLCGSDLDAALVILDTDPYAVSKLSPRTLAPLLEHRDRHVRERAIGALARAGRTS